jgi:hypothetical protein
MANNEPSAEYEMCEGDSERKPKVDLGTQNSTFSVNFEKELEVYRRTFSSTVLILSLPYAPGLDLVIFTGSNEL